MSGVPLFEHIKFMMRTTGPAFAIALTAYLTKQPSTKGRRL